MQGNVGTVQPVRVQAALNYVVANGEKPVAYAVNPYRIAPRGAARYHTHDVLVSNARVSPPPGGPSLDRTGFALRRHESLLDDFSSEARIRSVYYPESASLLKQWTGASQVLIFDHRVCDGAPAGAQAATTQSYVHNDQTFVSGPRRAHDVLWAHALERPPSQRFAIVSLWRPLRRDGKSADIALCDSRSIDLHDLVPSDLIHRDTVGEVYAFVHNPRHRWYYFHAMTPDECMLIKSFDSAGDGIARLSALTEFHAGGNNWVDGSCQGIELRSILIF